MPEERVQKILARAGYASRRASEELITAGRVRVNGVVAELGSKADPTKDTITVDNQPVAEAQAPVYIALNKPPGILSEVSPDEPRETVRDLVPVPGHLFIVGRLDMESEGLILLTNDGELANKLTHPRYGHEKEYRVLAGTRPDSRQLEAWRHGVVLEDGYRTAPANVRIETIAGKNAWLRVVLREGRKRQIREMGRLTGVPVLRIQRIRIGSLLLGELKPGEWRNLRPEEVRALKVNKPYREEAPSEGRRSAGRVRRASGAGEGAAATRTGARGGGRPSEGGRNRQSGGPGRGGGPSRGGGPVRGGRPARGGRPGAGGESDQGDRPARGGRPGGSAQPDRESPRAGARPGGSTRSGPSPRPGSGSGRTRPGGSTGRSGSGRDGETPSSRSSSRPPARETPRRRTPK